MAVIIKLPPIFKYGVDNMTYKESLDIAFLKTDSESSDYESKLFPVLANEAQMYIAKYGTHIVRKIEIETDNTPYRMELPKDFYRVALQGMVYADDELNGAEFYIVDDNNLVIPEAGKYKFYYYALPTDITKLSDEELDNYEYEIAGDTHVAIPAYIGYQLVKSDDVQLAQVLMDEWNKYLSLFDGPVKTIKRKIRR